MFNHASKLWALVCCLLCLLLPATGQTQGDGPRAYFPAPGHTHIVSGFGIFSRGNQSYNPGTVIKGADIDVNVAAVQYGYGWDLGGHASGILAVAPTGAVDGQVQLPGRALGSRSSGLGDAQLGFAYGVVGLPYLTRENFLQFDPGFTLAVVAKWLANTGVYDAEQPINFGSNRDAIQVLLPMAWYFGESLGDADLTTLELVPSVTWFGDNDDPYGATRLEQDPLYKLEGHFTRNFNRALWGSLDAFYQAGGVTTTDGVDDDNRQNSFSLGATLGMNLSASLSMQVSYGETVSHQTEGLEGRMYRLKVTALF